MNGLRISMHGIELKLRSHGHSGTEIAEIGMEELQCRLLHIAHADTVSELDAERRRLLSAPFTDERELRRALRGIELKAAALEDCFWRRHPAGEERNGN